MTPRRTAVSTACVALLTAAAAQGQSLGVGFAVAHARHDLFAPVVTGAFAHVAIGRARGADWHMDFERVWGTHGRYGVPCGGFVVLPCPAEPLRDSGSMIIGSIGFAGPRVAIGSVALTTSLAVAVAKARITTRGLTSQRELEGRGSMLGPRIGGDLLWRLPTRAPLGMRLGGSVSALVNVIPTSLDAYEPFAGVLTYRAVHLGVTWR